MRKTETESSTVVWDEGGDGEEHPFGRQSPRFYEPTYSEGESQNESKFDEGPKFDENGSDFDEDECLFVNRVLNRLPIQEGADDIHDNDSIIIGGDVAVMGGVGANVGGGEPVLDVPIMLPQVTGSAINFKIQEDDNMGVAMHKPSVIIAINSVFPDKKIEDIKVALDVVGPIIFRDSICPMQYSRWLQEKDDKLIQNGDSATMKLYEKVTDNLYSNSEQKKVIYTCGKGNNINNFKGSVGKCKFTSRPLQNIHVERFKSIVNARRSNAPFDPGGTGQEPEETTCEVKLLGWVLMIIINVYRVDVPFDPGGFALKTKLEDEFFRRRGV
ncbi:hypothetical protein Hanom_Chr02g00119801 [Helianthus anomalus]